MSAPTGSCCTITIRRESISGRESSFHRQKYFDKGLPLPVNIVLGSDPLVWFAAACPVPAGLSEFDYAGGLKGTPVTVIKSDLSGLPYPADAEIVLEGEIRPNELRDEGPFGEWPGYYASAKRQSHSSGSNGFFIATIPLSLARIRRAPRIPELCCARITRSAHVWEDLEKA